MSEQVEVSEERVEEEMRKMRDELLAIYEPIRRQMVAAFEADMAFLKGITVSEQQPASRGRPKRNAFKNATNKISNQANPPTKLRRPDSTDGTNVNIYDHLNLKHDEQIENNILRILRDNTNTFCNPQQDTSVILVNDDSMQKLHEISDDENQMPPPREPVKAKKRGRRIKKEKISLLQVKNEKDADAPIRRSNRLNTTHIPKEIVISTAVQEKLNDKVEAPKLLSETVEPSSKTVIHPVQTQNDTVESVYEDAVTINTIVEPALIKNEHTSILKIGDISQVLVTKAVVNDTKMLHAAVAVIKIESISKLDENARNVQPPNQFELEVIPDNTCDQTFVKAYNPNITHIVQSEIYTPEKQCNDRTVVLQYENTPCVLNSTVIIEKNNIINETFDVQICNVPEAEHIEDTKIYDKVETKKLQSESTQSCNDILEGSSLITDDDSEVDLNIEINIQQKSKSICDGNVLFSSQSPVKCRVKAFEKVIASEQQSPKPMTRKTRKEQVVTKENTPISDPGNNSKISKLPTSLKKTSQILIKPKLYTPQTNTRTLKGFTPVQKSSSNSNMSATNARNMVSSLTTFLPKTNATTKAISKEEVIKKQQAKEEEAMRKKEQILHEKQEELKRKRMEKERVVQQTRDQQAREKQLQIEKNAKEKEKKKILLHEQEEKKKQMLLKEREEKKREEKRLKQAKKEEEETERLRAKQQAEEAAERERKRQAFAQYKAKQLKLQEQKKQMEKQISHENAKMPKTAMADGFENLGSDYSTDDEDRPPKFERPKWAAYEIRQRMLVQQSSTSHVLIDQFFQMDPATPDLREIFPKIQKEKLQRKSSAVWRTPPRYSVLQKY